MGEASRSSLPWWYLLFSLMFLRRSRRRPGDQAADGRCFASLPELARPTGEARTPCEPITSPSC
jgi:hypothetical protein